MALYMDIMPYFNKEIHNYSCEYIVVSLEKYGRPQMLQLPILDTQLLNPG